MKKGIPDLSELLDRTATHEDALPNLVGLDDVTLRLRKEELVEFCRRADVLNHQTWVGNPLEDQVESYGLNASLILYLVGEDLSGYRTVVIGPDVAGIAFLAYIAQKGSSVLGIDVNIRPRNIAEKLGVPFVAGRWEDLTIHLKNAGMGKVDFINVNNMESSPWRYGRYKYQGQGVFEAHVTEEIDAVLNPPGLFIEVFYTGEYSLNMGGFRRMGYKCHYHNIDHAQLIRVLQKPVHPKVLPPVELSIVKT